MDSPPEERFNRHTRLARRLFDVPIAAVSLVDTDRQFFKSMSGLDIAETSREVSFCGHTILEAGPMVISDAHIDARFRDNPLVTTAPEIRFYAGVPLVVQGAAIGTLCIIDRHARQLSADDLGCLRDLGDMVTAEMSSLQQATTDLMTGLCNRRGLRNAAAHLFRADELHPDILGPLSLITLDLNHFKAINDCFGHEAGDDALKAMAGILEQVFRASDWIARLGGDEFCVLSSQSGPIAVAKQLERLERAVIAFNRGRTVGSWTLSYSAGAAIRARDIADLDALLRVADDAMYHQKVRHHSMKGPLTANR